MDGKTNGMNGERNKQQRLLCLF